MALRTRRFFLTIHNEDKGKQRIIEILNNPCGTIKEPKCAFIEHNKDIDENGELKNTHWHAVIEYKNARSFESARKLFEGCHIEESKNLYATIQYLTHKNDPEKHQYNFEDIITNDEKWLKTAYNTPIQQETKDKESELIKGITEGEYKNFYELIISQEYDMVFLNQRRFIIETLFNYKERLNLENKVETEKGLIKTLRQENEELKKQLELLKGSKIVS